MVYNSYLIKNPQEIRIIKYISLLSKIIFISNYKDTSTTWKFFYVSKIPNYCIRSNPSQIPLPIISHSQKSGERNSSPLDKAPFLWRAAFAMPCGEMNTSRVHHPSTVHRDKTAEHAVEYFVKIIGQGNEWVAKTAGRQME